MKMIPLAKQTKKKQKAFHASKRGFWNMSPVTRKVESRKAYDRNRAKRDERSLGNDE